MNKEKSRGYPGKSYPRTQKEKNLMSRSWEPGELEEMEEEKEAKDREIIQLIQSRCVHRRMGILKLGIFLYDQKFLYCQDCLKPFPGKTI